MLLTRNMLCGALVFFLCIFLSALAGWQQARNNHNHVQEELATATLEIERALTARLKVYEYRLRGIRGAIHMIGESKISRAQFERYGQARNLDLEYPGARGFGYIRKVPRSRVEAFLVNARADGRPDFQIWQLAPHNGDLFVIQYVEPAERNAQAIGLDIASEHKRRYAAVMAAASGKATLTSPINLVQVAGFEESSFLFLLPVYRDPVIPQSPELRRFELLGWSYAPLAMSEVMAFLDIAPKGLQLQLTDITDSPEGQLIYRSETVSGQAGIQTYTLERAFFGRTWRMDVSADSIFLERLEPVSPLMVFAAGSLASALLALITVMLLMSRDRRQESLAAQARLATIVENSSDAIIGEALDGRIITWNHAAEQMFGYPESAVLGKPLAPLLVPAERLEEDQAMLAQASRGERSSAMETQRLHRDGRLIDVAITCSLIREPDGCILGVAKLMHDISDRKRAENYLKQFNIALEEQVSQRTAELTRVAGLLQAVLDASSEVSIIATDMQGQVMVFNRGAEQLLGYRAEEMIGKGSPKEFHMQGEIEARSAELTREYGTAVEGVDVFHYKADLEGSETREWTYVCGFHAIRPPSPLSSGQAFHGHLATCSTAIRPGSRSAATQGWHC
ncbi:CHASE domain-containing protein [Pseudomonas wenzhouensis]|uniref:CHASE domain-containing protein n=1 Tax=Pseudomonas wenzhouensis TaxID=2906062 RepID=UPI001E3D17FA|nr:CHASE domain-containing protein [Pseudomonas wenzhouensis]